MSTWDHNAGPGRSEQAKRLLALYHEIAAKRHRGATIFIAGDESQGRAAVMKAVASQLWHSGCFVLAGRLESDGFESWDPGNRRGSTGLALLEAIMPMAQALHPALALFSLAVDEGDAAWTLASRIKERGGGVDPGLMLPQLIRLKAERGPVACFIDQAEDTQMAWWEDLLILFAQEIVMDLPVLFVVGLDGPADLGPLHERLDGGLYAAHSLTRRGLAEWWPLGSVSNEHLLAWTGAADPSAIDALLEASGGRSALAAELWDGWRAVGLVQRKDRSHPWSLTSIGKTNLFVERLKHLVDPDAVLPGVEHARLVLSVAALEGRQFTAEAVAQALDIERDELLDYLDSTLTASETHPGGFVAEVGAITVEERGQTRHLWVYRFVDDRDHLTSRYSILTPQAQAHYSQRLAEALRACYGAATSLVAATVARLYDASGSDDLASAFWRMTRVDQDDDVNVWRAQRLLKTADPTDDIGRQRATEMLLAAASALYDGHDIVDGLAFSQAAVRLAKEASPDRGSAHYYAAWYQMRLGHYEQTRSDLEVALAIASRHQDSARAADATHQLANVDYAEGESASARARYQRVLDTRIRLGDVFSAMKVRQMLATLDAEDGDFDGAKRQLREVLAMTRDLTAATAEIETLTRIAQIEEQSNGDAAARACYEEALEIISSTGADGGYWEGQILIELAMLEDRCGDLAAARSRIGAASDLVKGNPGLEAKIHQIRASIEVAASDFGAARTELHRALGLYRAMGNTDGERATLGDLDARVCQFLCVNGHDGCLGLVGVESLAVVDC